MRIKSCLAISQALVAGAQFLFPQGTGPYRSSLTISELVDQSRPDPFNSTHLRRVMVSRFDPIAAKKCKSTRVPYMTPATAAEESVVLAGYDYPPIFDQFFLEVCKAERQNSEIGGKKQKFPIALFSPGLNTTRLFYSSLAQEIASHGFIVITIDHPYDIDVVEFPDGSVIYGGSVNTSSDASIEHALDVRAQDASFVLDTLRVKKSDKVVMFGHSFGGAATATSMLKDKRIRAGVNLDGFMFGPVLNTSIGSVKNPQAFVLWGSEGHNTTTDETWGQFWGSMKIPNFVDYRKQLTIANSSHGSYWDLNLLVDIAGIRDQLSEKAQSIIGPVPGPRVFEILGRYLSSYFWFTLGTKQEDKIWRGASDKYPEVLISDE